MNDRGHVDVGYIVDRMYNGILELISCRVKSVICAIYLILGFIIIVHTAVSKAETETFLSKQTVIGVILLVFLGAAIMIYIMGAPLNSVAINMKLERIGLVNSFGEAPKLLSDRDGVMIFHSSGIPVDKWLKKQADIETSLNILIEDVKNYKDVSHIQVLKVSGSQLLPEFVRWDEDYLPHSESEVAVGLTESGIRTIDFATQPHVICQGVTSSGKTTLLRTVLWQAYEKGFFILLVDFKNLVDFDENERKRYKTITSREQLNTCLKEAVDELERRKQVLSECCCPNIDIYNKHHPEFEMQRILIASDEIALAFIKSSDKKEKELTFEITQSMSIIAQQGRAFGIHLWMQTQRGDAETIPPQVRSNINTRLCGRADETLSLLAIGNSEASNIPKSVKGRFADDEGGQFQAFWYE